jgi:hypothetical protein
MWVRLIRALPWRMIIASTPKIVDAARTLYEARKRAHTSLPEIRATRPGADPRELQHAIDTLEEHATRQAAIVAQLAQQLESMAAAIEIMRRRVALAMTAALVASGLAVLFAAVAFLRG